MKQHQTYFSFRLFMTQMKFVIHFFCLLMLLTACGGTNKETVVESRPQMMGPAASAEPNAPDSDPNRPIVSRWKMTSFENADLEDALDPQAKASYYSENQKIVEKGYAYFRADGRFEGNFRGMDDDKGQWELSKDNKRVTIALAESVNFDIELVNESELILRRKVAGQTMRWFYKKF